MKLKDYSIEFSKKPRAFSFNPSKSKYICNMTIKNNIGVVLLSIDANEFEFGSLLYALYSLSMFYNQVWGDNVYFSPSTSNLRSYIYSLKVIDQFEDLYESDQMTISDGTTMTTININEYDTYTDSLINRFNLYLSYEDSLDFCDGIYNMIVDIPGLFNNEELVDLQDYK